MHERALIKWLAVGRPEHEPTGWQSGSRPSQPAVDSPEDVPRELPRDLTRTWLALSLAAVMGLAEVSSAEPPVSVVAPATSPQVSTLPVPEPAPPSGAEQAEKPQSRSGARPSSTTPRSAPQADEKVSSPAKSDKGASRSEPSDHRLLRYRPLDRDQLRYAGRTFDAWTMAMLTELDPDEQARSFSALAKFAAQGYETETAEVLVDVAHGFDWIGVEMQIQTQIVSYFAGVPENVWRPLLVRELKSQDPASERFALVCTVSLGDQAEPVRDEVLALFERPDVLTRMLVLMTLRPWSQTESRVRKVYEAALSHPELRDHAVAALYASSGVPYEFSAGLSERSSVFNSRAVSLDGPQQESCGFLSAAAEVSHTCGLAPSPQLFERYEGASLERLGAHPQEFTLSGYSVDEFRGRLPQVLDRAAAADFPPNHRFAQLAQAVDQGELAPRLWQAAQQAHTLRQFALPLSVSADQPLPDGLLEGILDHGPTITTLSAVNAHQQLEDCWTKLLKAMNQFSHQEGLIRAMQVLIFTNRNSPQLTEELINLARKAKSEQTRQGALMTLLLLDRPTEGGTTPADEMRNKLATESLEWSLGAQQLVQHYLAPVNTVQLSPALPIMAPHLTTSPKKP